MRWPGQRGTEGEVAAMAAAYIDDDYERRGVAADVQGPARTLGRYVMIGRTYLERGRPVVVLVRWSGKGPRNVLIRREDGRLVVRPFRGLRLPR